MTFKSTQLPGAFEICLEPIPDDRGFFARSWCRKEFEYHGLTSCLAQCNISFNLRKGTLRGLHYQTAPREEAKLVRCIRGRVYDVVLDLRENSPTFKGWVGLELSAVNRNMVYVPEGCAHGFLTVEDETEVFYQISEFYDPTLQLGVRWNDPAFGITWPGEVKVISERDRVYPDFGAGR